MNEVVFLLVGKKVSIRGCALYGFGRMQVGYLRILDRGDWDDFKLALFTNEHLHLNA